MAGIDLTNSSHVAAVIQYAGNTALPTSIWDVGHTLRPLRLLPDAYGGGEASPAAVMGAGIYWLHARPSRHFEVVGEVLAVHRRDTHMEYLLDDGTGLMWARLAHTRVLRSEAPSACQLGRSAVAISCAAQRAKQLNAGHRGFADERVARLLSAKARGKLPMPAPAQEPAATAHDLDILRPRPPRDYARYFGYDLHTPFRFPTRDPGIPEEYRAESRVPSPPPHARRRPRAYEADEWGHVPAVAEDAIEVGDLLWVRAKIGRWLRQPTLQIDRPGDLGVVDLTRQDAHVEAYYTASLPDGAYHQLLSGDEVPLPQYRTLPWDGDTGAEELYKRMRLLHDLSPEVEIDDPLEKQQEDDEAKRRYLFELARSPTSGYPEPDGDPSSVIQHVASPTFGRRQREHAKAFSGNADQPPGAVQVHIATAPVQLLTREQEAFKAQFDGGTSCVRSSEQAPRSRARVSGMTEFTAAVLAQEEAHYDGDRTLDAQATPKGRKRVVRGATPTPKGPKKRRKRLLPPERLPQKHITTQTVSLYVLEWIQAHCSGRGQPPAWTIRYLRRAARLQAIVGRVLTAYLARRGKPSEEGVRSKSKRLFTHVVQNLWKSGKIVPAAAGVHVGAPFDGRCQRRLYARSWSRTNSWGTTAEEWLSIGGDSDAPPSSGAYAGMEASASMRGSLSEAEDDDADVSEPEKEEIAYQLVTPTLIIGTLRPLLKHAGLHRLNDPAQVKNLLKQANEEWQHVSVEDVRQALTKAWGAKQDYT